MNRFVAPFFIFFVSHFFSKTLFAQRSDTLIQLAFTKEFILAHSIEKIEADFKDEKFMTVVSRFTFNLDGTLQSYKKLEKGLEVYSRTYFYDKKGRVNKMVIKEKKYVQTHKFTYSKDLKSYESAVRKQNGKWLRLITGNYTYKIFDRYADIDSLGRIKRSFTHYFDYGKTEFTSEGSVSYEYTPTSIIQKELVVFPEQSKQVIKFHNYQFEKDEKNRVNCVQYQYNNEKEQLYDYLYNDEFIMILTGKQKIKYYLIERG